MSLDKDHLLSVLDLAVCTGTTPMRRFTFSSFIVLLGVFQTALFLTQFLSAYVVDNPAKSCFVLH